MTVVRRLVVTVMAVAALAGCVAHPVGPARTYDSFDAKASTTAESALSAVETVRLLASTASDGGAFSSYVAVSVSEQEDALGGRARHVRVDPAAAGRRGRGVARRAARRSWTGAFDHVGDVRIEVRRGHLATSTTSRRRSPPTSTALRTLMEEPAVKRVLGVFLGILTAIGGFVDMGDLVANAATGARFRHEPGVGRRRSA